MAFIYDRTSGRSVVVEPTADNFDGIGLELVTVTLDDGCRFMVAGTNGLFETIDEAWASAKEYGIYGAPGAIKVAIPPRADDPGWTLSDFMSPVVTITPTGRVQS